MLTRPKGHKTWWAWSSTLNHHPAKFCIHRCCGSAVIRLVICHLATWWKHHVTWWMGSPNPNLPLPSLVAIGVVEVEYKNFFVVRWPSGRMWFDGRSLRTWGHHHAKFGGSRIYSKCDLIFAIPIPIPIPSSNAQWVYKWPNASENYIDSIFDKKDW